jgi:hypothetical protein
MADTANTDLKEKGHAPDKSEASGAGHCPHCENHGDRIAAIETKLGMKAQPGAAREESGVHRDRKRH